MKKILLVLIAILLTFGLLLSCGDDTGNDDDSKNNDGIPADLEKNILRVTAVEEWHGFDLLHSAINFTVGDEVYVIGSTNSNSFLLNGKPGGQHDINYPHIKKGDFEETKILTEEDIENITAEQAHNAPKGIRVQPKEAGRWFIIEELTVKRGENVVFSLSEEIKDAEPGEIEGNAFNNLSKFWQACGDPKFEIIGPEPAAEE